METPECGATQSLGWAGSKKPHSPKTSLSKGTPAQTESDEARSADTGPAETELAKPEPAETGVNKGQEGRVEAARVEAAQVEAARVEAARVEAARVEAARVEAARVEAARVEAARVEAALVEAALDEEAKNKCPGKKHVDRCKSKFKKKTKESIKARKNRTEKLSAEGCPTDNGGESAALKCTPWNVFGVGLALGYDHAPRTAYEAAEAPGSNGFLTIQEGRAGQELKGLLTFHLHSPIPSYRLRNWTAESNFARFMDWAAWRPNFVLGVSLRDIRQHVVLGGGFYIVPGIAIAAAAHRYPIRELLPSYQVGDTAPISGRVPARIAGHNWGPYIGVTFDSSLIVFLYQELSAGRREFSE